MLELEHVSAAQRELDGLVAEVAVLREESFRLRMVLSAVCEAVEAWGQWTMSGELAGVLAQASSTLGGRLESGPGL